MLLDQCYEVLEKNSRITNSLQEDELITSSVYKSIQHCLVYILLVNIISRAGTVFKLKTKFFEKVNEHERTNLIIIICDEIEVQVEPCRILFCPVKRPTSLDTKDNMSGCEELEFDFAEVLLQSSLDCDNDTSNTEKPPQQLS